MRRLTCFCSLNDLWMGQFGAKGENFRSSCDILNVSLHQFLSKYLGRCQLVFSISSSNRPL